MSSYIESKKQEIDYLASFSGSSTSLFSLKTTEDVRLAKKSLIKTIKKNALDQIEYPVTNLSNQNLNYYGQDILYTYAREGYRFGGESKFRFVHPHSLADIQSEHEFAAFTSSAQGTMAIVLTFIKSVEKDISFYRPANNIYFDTVKVIKSLEAKQSYNKCLVIDYSISDLSLYKEISFDDYNIIVVDATCLVTGSILEKEVFTKLRKSNAAIFIIKSLIKTDSFGEEYAQLGSLYAFNLEYFDKYKGIEYKTSEDFFHKYFGRYGGFSNLESLYPFYWDKEYHLLNLARVERLQQNLISIESDFLSNGQSLFLKKHHHQLFSLIKIKSNEEKFGLKVERLKAKASLPLFWGSSFGLDSCLFTTFKNFHSNSNNTYFRFTGLDADPHSLNGISRFIQILLKEFIWEE